jgi:hypothetical protein
VEVQIRRDGGGRSNGSRSWGKRTDALNRCAPTRAWRTGISRTSSQESYEARGAARSMAANAFGPSTRWTISTGRPWASRWAPSLPAAKVVRALDRIAAWRGQPAKLRLDKGPELASVGLAEGAEDHAVALDVIQPASPPRICSSSVSTGPMHHTRDGAACMPALLHGMPRGDRWRFQQPRQKAIMPDINMISPT